MDYSNSEWMVFLTCFLHILLVPSTKVEESFNVQATHDLLFNNPMNLTTFDHMTFPGVVPRTFMGPIILAVCTLPISLFLRLISIPKMWQLVLVRAGLGVLNCIALLKLGRAIEKIFGKETATFLRLILCSQFHFMFYISRPLPNSFALFFVLMVYEKLLTNHVESAVRWATAVTFIYRIELILLFAPVFLIVIFNGRLPIFGHDGAVLNGIRTLIKVLAITVPIDSYFWGKLVWPEYEVAYFNIIQNKSGNYGTSPFLWYFYSALPRGLMFSLFLAPLGVLLDRRLYKIIGPVIVFISLYSLLPHKELRFIIYGFPIISLSSAVFCARMYLNRKKSVVRFLLYAGCVAHLFANLSATGVLLMASSRNYPGADAINYLQRNMRFDALKPVSVYVDNACAQTGVSRFLQINDAWTYNKTENMKVEDLKNFDFLLMGTYGDSLKKDIEELASTHRPLVFINGFHKYIIKKSKSFPWIYPSLIYKEKSVVLKNKEYW